MISSKLKLSVVTHIKTYKNKRACMPNPMKQNHITTYMFNFGYIRIISHNIVEITVNAGIEVDLEMVEECDNFLVAQFKEDFGLIINKINDYTFSYEAQLCILSVCNLKAIALVYYSEQNKKLAPHAEARRESDKLNVKAFSGYEFGHQNAQKWLNEELNK